MYVKLSNGGVHSRSRYRVQNTSRYSACVMSETPYKGVLASGEGTRSTCGHVYLCASVPVDGPDEYELGERMRAVRYYAEDIKDHGVRSSAPPDHDGASKWRSGVAKRVSRRCS